MEDPHAPRRDPLARLSVGLRILTWFAKFALLELLAFGVVEARSGPGGGTTVQNVSLSVGNVTLYPNMPNGASVIGSASQCNATDGDSGLVKLSNLADLYALGAFLTNNGVTGKIAIANNVLQSFPNGDYSNFSAAWEAAIFPSFPTSASMPLSDWSHGGTGDCAYIAKEGNTNKWVIFPRQCVDTSFASTSLLCLNPGSTCGPPPWQGLFVKSVIDTKGKSHDMRSTQIPFGTKTKYRCPFALPTRALAAELNTTAQCYGSFGWWPGLQQHPCPHRPNTCAHNGRRYAVARGTEGAGITYALRDCYYQFDGSAYEHTSLDETLALLRGLSVNSTDASSCIDPDNSTVYIGPTAWTWINNKTNGTTLTPDEYSALFVRSNGTQLTTASLFRDGQSLSAGIDQKDAAYCLTATLQPDGSDVLIQDSHCWMDLPMICAMNNTHPEKLCLTPPRNTTGDGVVATMVANNHEYNNNQTSYYTAYATFRCPCGHAWDTTKSAFQTDPARPWMRITALNQVKRSIYCQANLGWGYYDLTRCVPSATPTLWLTSGWVFMASVSPDFSGNHFDAAETCSDASPGAGLITLRNGDDFTLRLVQFLDDFCNFGEVPVGNNIIQSIEGEITAEKFADAWNATVTSVGIPWLPGEPSFKQENPALCAVISWNGTSYGFKAKHCEDFSSAPGLVCQNESARFCGPPPRPRKVVSYSSGQPVTATQLQNGTIVTHGCKRVLKVWNTTNTDVLEQKLTCFASIGWYPKLDAAECVGPDVCSYKGANFINIRISETEDIVAGAEECYHNFSGAVHELRNFNYTRDFFLSTLQDDGDGSCWNNATDGVFWVAPTAWRWKETLPKNRVISSPEIQLYWRFADGTAVSSSIYGINATQPNNGGAGNQFCTQMTFWGVIRDGACNEANTGTLCQINASKILTSCRQPPRNPTNGSGEATITYSQPSDTAGLYPFGTMAEFTCPCGYEWANDTNWPLPLHSFGGNSSVRRAKCLGTLDWATYEVTNCVSLLSGFSKEAQLTNGTAHLNLSSWSGNHTQAAVNCFSLNGSWTLPVVSNQEDLFELESLLELNCVKDGELPMAHNILKQLDGDGSNLSDIDFMNAWDTVVQDSSLWHLDEPKWTNGSEPAACSVLTLRNETWKLAAKNCSDISRSNVTLCLSGALGSKCRREDIPGLQLLDSFVNGTSTSAPILDFNSTTILKCPCGSSLPDTVDPRAPIASSRCFGSFGWFPVDVPTCEPVSTSINITGTTLDLLSSNQSTFPGSIFEAEKACHSLGPQYGLPKTIPPHVFGDANVSKFLNIHCVANPLAMAANILRASDAERSATTFMGTWGAVMPNVTFWATGEPTRLDTTQQPMLCSMVKRNASGAWRLFAASCGSNLFGPMVLCEEGPGFCADPPPIPSLITNMTNGKRPTDQEFPYNTSAVHECPGGKPWKNTTSSILHPSVTCQGSLGWHPRFDAQCTYSDMCYHNNDRYVFVNASYNASIVEAAKVCYNVFKGAVYEFRDVNESQVLIGSFLDQNCVPNSQENPFVAPASWAFKDQLPVNRTLNDTEIDEYWRYSDGNSFNRSLFNPSRPRNEAGNQFCLRLNMSTGEVFDKECKNRPHWTLCKANATPALTECPDPPMNAASGLGNATVNATADMAPYSFGAIAEFTCQCGFQWTPINPDFAIPNASFGGDVRTRRAMCLGTLGWATYEVTSCVPAWASVVGKNYTIMSGNGSLGVVEASRACFNELGGSLAQPYSAEQFEKFNDLLVAHCTTTAFFSTNVWWNLEKSAALASTPLTARPQIFQQLWKYTNGTSLPTNFPFLDKEPNNYLGGEQCLRLLSRNQTSWGLQDVPCVGMPATGKIHYFCSPSESPACGPPQNPTICEADAASIDFGTTGNQSSYPFGSRVKFVCPKGYAWALPDPADKSLPKSSLSIRNETTLEVECLGTLGWTLFNLTYCVPWAFAIADGKNYTIMSLRNGTLGVMEAARQCHIATGGALAQPTSSAQLLELKYLMSALDLTEAYLATNAWWNTDRAAALKGVELKTQALLDTIWRQANGSTLPPGLQFSPRDPNNARGNEQCLVIRVANQTVWGLEDTQCEKPGKQIYYFCSQQEPSSCGAPYNPTLTRGAAAHVDFGTLPPNSTYAFGSRVNFVCPSGYVWGLPDPSWEHRPKSSLTIPSESVTVECLGTLGWTLYNLTYCVPTGTENVTYDCSLVEPRNYAVFKCVLTCRNTSANWKSGLQSRNATCYPDGSCDAYNDECMFSSACDANIIPNVTGALLTWNRNNSVGTNVTYSCPEKFAIGGRKSLLGVSVQSQCLFTGQWSSLPANTSCEPVSDCDPDALPNYDVNIQRYFSGHNWVGDYVIFYLEDDVVEYCACQSNGQWDISRKPKWFPERIPVPTLPSYPVDFVETTLYHWGRAVENATCTGCLTGNISAPIESPGPTQFGQGVEIRGWDNECLEDNDFERRANFTCFANPMTCANGSNGISMGFFYKRGIPMKDVYLVYFNPKNSSANYPTKETLVSSGGDREGHPGIHVWWEGPFLGVLVSTGELYWEVLFLPKLFNDTWNNIGFRWFRPTPGVDDDGRLEVLINVEQQAATNQAKRASRVQSMLLPPTMLMGCHKDSTNTQKRFYGEGFFDEVAFWDTFIFDNTSRMFAGGYLPELNGVPTSVILDSIRESAKLEDERTRQVAWIAVQSIASDTNMTSEPVRPADAALNKTGETPSQQVENLVKFVTTLQSAEYISSSNSIGAVAKAARTSMSATSTLLCGNRHAWEEIADAGYKPGAYALVKSQNDYFMNMADSIAVDTKMTSAQMIDVTSDEIVSKLGVARIGHLRQSPTLKFPNYEDEIWGNGSMSKKFDYPVDTIEVPLGLYFPSSKTCDGTNLVNIEMNAYKNLDDFMPPNKVNPLKIVSQDNVIDSNILYFAFTLNKNIPKAKVAGCQPDALAMISNPIKLLFRHKMDEPAQEAGFKSRKLKFHTEEVEYNIKVRRCVWWNPSMNEFGGWDPSGCNIYDTADNFTMCECAAQGLFGILGEMIQHYELPTEPTWLTVVKFVGYGLSILCLPLFIVIVLKSKDHLHDQFHIMRANLAFALLVGLILHCVSDLHSIRDSRHACTAISVMFHYFYTAAGAWFCFESYASFVAITQGIIGGKLRAYIPLCWGLPFLSVGAALIQDMLSYGTDPRCMISFDNEMKWIFFGPLLTFASIGFLLSAIVICNISTPALRKDHIADELVSVGQGLAAQVTYFLCTWIAGVCAYFIYDWTIETPGFYALFQVLNAYTGVFYLVFMGFISLRFRMVVLGVAQKRKLMILQYLTRNQHEQLKPTPSVDNQQSDELPDELFAEGGPSSGRRKILTST